MPSRSLEHLHPTLVSAWNSAKAAYQAKYPGMPQPFLTCTYRSKEEQAALFAQSRSSLVEVNRLRKIAGMPPITSKENMSKVTNAQPGQSAHNYNPSFAFDIAFILDGKLHWEDKYFKLFADIICQQPSVVWGGSWKSIKDLPHFELLNWKSHV